MVFGVKFFTIFSLITLFCVFSAAIGKSNPSEKFYYHLNDSTPETAKWVQNEEIQIFREYLRIPTVTHVDDLGRKMFFISVSIKNYSASKYTYYINYE